MRANTNRIFVWIDKAVDAVVVLLVGLMVLVVSCNVFARYCLKIGLTWAEEFSMLLFVWVVFLGAYVALRNKAHLALTFIIRRLPGRFRQANRLLILLLTAGFLSAMTWGGFQLAKGVLELGQRTALLRISSAWSLASVPVAGLLMLGHVLVTLFGGGNIIDEGEETKEGGN